MMNSMSLEELGMEVDALEDRAREMMERMETGDNVDVQPDYQEEYENTVVEMTEVSPMDENEITFTSNSRIQIGQIRTQKSKMESIPRIVNSKVEERPRLNNILHPACYPEKENSPLSGQTGFHSSGFCGGRKRKFKLIEDFNGPDYNGCVRSRPGMCKRIKLSHL